MGDYYECRRITKLEFKSEEALKQAEITYDKIRDFQR